MDSRYIERKSLGLDKVKEFLAELEASITEDHVMDDEVSDAWEVIQTTEKEGDNNDAPPEEEVRKERKEKPIVQVIGYVESIRKIQTKKGDNMLIVWCASTGWKFTSIVFPKAYNQVAHLFKEWEIVLVKGRLNCKIEMKEISIEADQVKRSTISDLRTAAQNEKIFGDEENAEEKSIKTEPIFTELQNKYKCIIGVDMITIKLASGTKKEVLLDIKWILETYPVGPYHVWLDIDGQMIDTKKNIGN
jgi:DNA polymerase III alpha subunit